MIPIIHTIRVLRVLRTLPLIHTRCINKLTPPTSPKRLLMKDIPMITVQANVLADRVRTNPEVQLHCVGGSGVDHFEYHPYQVMCINMGVDANGKVNWVCQTSSISSKVQIGDFKVSFEGWSGPDDLYVRAGSEVVRYELHMTDDASADKLLLFIIIVGVLLVFIAYRSDSLIVVHTNDSHTPSSSTNNTKYHVHKYEYAPQAPKYQPPQAPQYQPPQAPKYQPPQAPRSEYSSRRVFTKSDSE
jgi:hypothetical protein